jgi:hypothetical protein
MKVYTITYSDYESSDSLFTDTVYWSREDAEKALDLDYDSLEKQDDEWGYSFRNKKYEYTYQIVQREVEGYPPEPSSKEILYWASIYGENWREKWDKWQIEKPKR